MKYFFPDSQDLVDPSFDFNTERRNDSRIRQRDDQYAHEVFSESAYDGLLVSKGIVDGFGGTGSRYTLGQRHRLYRVGAPEFFRTAGLPVMGDCGAFTYVRESEPPYSVDEVLAFYTECGFDLGISVDHVILAFQPQWDEHPDSVPRDIRQRQQLTIELASKFFLTHQRQGLRLQPLGVAQGWSPASYAHAVGELQKIGYEYIALGGMVPLKSAEILSSLEAIDRVRSPNTKLHLLGVTRTDHVARFAKFGVVSFDSTSPLRQAFKDDKNNYYTMDRAFTAVRIPQVQGNPGLQKAIAAGRVSQSEARRLELACLAAMRNFDAGTCGVESVVDVLAEYEHLYDPKHDHSAAYRDVLTAAPWKHCGCDICKRLGYHVILFRGAERNRRRGLHNVWVFYRRLKRELGLEYECAA